MATFAKPENALKRAEELIHLGQTQAALQALHDLITSKRYRSWQKPLETIMLKYVELCVELRKGRFAKDGLIRYRIICQQVSVTSFEEVVKHFVQLSSEKAVQAMGQSQALEDVKDLEVDQQRPEDLMLSFVSGEKGKDRSDSEAVTAWFKFLWEAFRTVLDILRNNSKFEALYAMTAQKAFNFCKQYKRTTEFRRLCEIIRSHLASLNSYRDQSSRPDLTAQETLQLYVGIRVEQLNIATDLSLWQEAFRSAEDIHGLMSLVSKMPKPSVLAVYYGKLIEIFWMSGCHLYHAYAWLKLYNLQKSYNKNLSQKDVQLMASSVLLAALSVAPYDQKYGASRRETENEKERNVRMGNLVNFSLGSKRENAELPSRASILSELVSRGVISCASQEVKDLYNLLEHEFRPLGLASKAQPLLSKISKVGGKLSPATSVPEIKLSQYISALEKLTTLRVLQQASSIFQSMKIDMLSRIIPFFDISCVEKISVDAVNCNFVAMKVDHLSGAVRFGSVDVESGGLSDHLIVLADSLNKARNLIHLPVKKPSKLGEDLISLAGAVENENKRLLARKFMIEKRKEELEQQILEKEKEEKKRLNVQKRTTDDERRRLLNDHRLREQDRIHKEIAEKEKREAEKLLEETLLRNKKKVKKSAIDGMKERSAMGKLQKLAKQMDYLERARRQEEAPLMEQSFQDRVEEEKILWEQGQLREIELSEQHHAADLQVKKRLSRISEHKNSFQEGRLQSREAEFFRVKKEADERLNQLILSRKRERETVRKLVHYLNMEEQRIKRKREEEEARKREEEARRKKEEAEGKAKLDAVAAKQLQRERELEEKEKLRREVLLRGGGPARVLVPTPLATAAAPATGKYVPRFKLNAGAGGGQRPAAAAQSERWGSSGVRQTCRPSYGSRHTLARPGPPSAVQAVAGCTQD